MITSRCAPRVESTLSIEAPPCYSGKSVFSNVVWSRSFISISERGSSNPHRGCAQSTHAGDCLRPPGRQRFPCPQVRSSLQARLRTASRYGRGLPHCTAHGLRKAAARRLAHAGASAHEIAAITGHESLREVERYTTAANEKRLAELAQAKVVAAFPSTKSERKT